jgi:hypothetical protein
MEFTLEGFIKRDVSWINKAKELYGLQEKLSLLETLEARLIEELKSISNEQHSQACW